MLDSKFLIVVLLIALVLFGTKKLRTIGSDLGAAVKGFKSSMNEGEQDESAKQLKHEKDAQFETAQASPDKVPPKTQA